ncbi:MAG: hypothetical protein IPK74_12660 [Deltaproteobacteria bacterium]|nr:hypothetical protein [Deltaproteobacteria bacterium]
MTDENVRWALYPWVEEHGTDLIHPDDLTTVLDLLPHGKVFRLVGEEGGFLRLRYGDSEFRTSGEP